MRILHAIVSLNPRLGGTVECINQIGSAMTSLGNTVEVVCLDAPNADWIATFPIPVHALGGKILNYGYSPYLHPWLENHLAEYDSVIINGIWQYPSVAVRSVARRKNVPYFVYVHGMLDPWSKRAYPFKYLKKSLYWPWAEYPVVRDAAGVFFTSEEERILAREYFPSIYRVRELVVSNGIRPPPPFADAQAELFFTRFPQLREKRILLFLGRIHEKKGCDLALSAFAATAVRERDHLVMAGSGEPRYEQTLRKLARRLAIEDSVTWTGLLDGDVKWGAFRACNVFLLPSHQENFGIAVVEALACGKPVLISDKINIWREIQATGAGLISSDDLQGTISALTTWFNFTQEQRSTLIVAARTCFETHFQVLRAARNVITAINGARALAKERTVCV